MMAPTNATTSPVWDHFSPVETGAKCLYCLKVFKYTKGTTSNLKRHLNLVHKTVPYLKQKQPIPQTINIDDEAGPSAVNFQPSNQYFNSNMSIQGYLKKPINSETKKVLDRMLLDLICKECLPFNLVESEIFKKFVYTLNPNYIMPTRKSLSNALLPSVYNQEFEKAKEKLSTAKAIAITSDGWTNLNQISFFALTGHYIDENCKLSSILIECSEFENPHSGRNIANWIQGTLNKFDIEDKIVAMVTDNASNMKAASTELNFCHIPCFAHTLNLIVRDAIKKSVLPVVEEVKRVVMLFKKSPKASQMLADTQKKLNLDQLKMIQEVSTRWNSGYDMLNRFYKNKIALLSCADSLKMKISLESHDWEAIEQIVRVLKYFYSATNIVSAQKYITISHVGLLCNVLLTKTSQFRNDEDIAENIQNLVALLIEGLQNKLKIYRSNEQILKSMILDPRIKQLGFQDDVEKFKNICESIISELLPLQKPAVEVEKVVKKVSKDVDMLFGDLFKNKGAQNYKTPRQIAENELHQYLSVENIDLENDPLLWWKEHQVLYPSLYTLAMSTLCIPGTSVPCERLFSKAGQIYSEKRSRLAPKKLQEILFIQQNA
uniref:E3 SUMO-protein ligase ZBED1-like n=1 Tax=Anopheles coluzzii TaxID=1518534 RepID=UPI0020FF8384|nr:E3 SUMO-protein ligase ZBED1-like [Anopheles coluzzii]